jgi:hypothetical protein
MLIEWIRVRYVPHDEGDGTGSENVHNDIQRSYSLLTLSRQDSLSSRITYRITEQGANNPPVGRHLYDRSLAALPASDVRAPASRHEAFGRWPGPLCLATVSALPNSDIAPGEEGILGIKATK